MKTSRRDFILKSTVAASGLALLPASAVLASKKEKNKPEGPVIVDPKKALTGTFVTLGRKHNWSQTQWDSQFQEMNDIGMDTAIVQFAAVDGVAWFDTSASHIKTIYPNVIPMLLAAAEKKEMSVHLGLDFSKEYWKNATNKEWLQLHADRANAVATELSTQFGDNPALKGWYISHEPSAGAYHSKELLVLLKDNLINRISDYLHTLDSRPVSISPFWNSTSTSPEQLKDFMAGLGKTNLQIIMLQDGVGVNHVTLDKVGQYYMEADRGLFENTGYKGEFWTDIETFSFAPQGPPTMDRLKIQLREEMATPHISKAVCFIYYGNMSADSSKDYAAKFRNEYIRFIKSME
ncbi:MAG TPA: DUF4434 domain-containing protein [Bacteroidales bacterium]|nr:DUF4434 domain-containing protein [Bacteroidales bacterium]HUX95702.1 DUF4434 domain-containing protein [Bacteroidales bacterium]